MHTTRMTALALGLLLLLLAAATTARGQCLETGKLTPIDGRDGDGVGVAVAIEGERALVGAPKTDGAEQDIGAAYVYDVTTGQRLLTLIPGNGARWDDFGLAVSLSENIALVGAPGADTVDASSGAVYIFDATSGAPLSMIVPGTQTYGAHFGWAVALEGSHAVIGAPGSGLCALFDLSDPASPVELAVFEPAVRCSGFGGAVAVDGTTVVVGTWDPFDPRAFVFDIADPHNPVEVATLALRNDSNGWDHRYGTQVGISGGVAIVGTYDFFPGRHTNNGTASLFDTATGQQIGTIHQPLIAGYDFFGYSVAIRDNVVAVGSIHVGDGLGNRVYLYDVSYPSVPVPIGMLAASDDDFASFGWSIAISCTGLLVGDPGALGEQFRSGAAYLFGLDTCDFCPADFNHDGELDTRDVLSFLNAWRAGDPEADFNYDGDLDTRDVLAFLNAWAVGC